MPTPPVAPEADREHYFRALEERRTSALVRRDLPTLEALHAPEYQLVTPIGRVFAREAYFERIAAAPFYASWEILDEISCRISDSMAALRYMAVIRFPSGREFLCWHLDTYELRASGWQAVWSQATELKREQF